MEKIRQNFTGLIAKIKKGFETDRKKLEVSFQRLRKENEELSNRGFGT